MILLYWAIPFFALSMLLEWRFTIGKAVKGYRFWDSAASVSMGLGNLVIMFLVKLVSLGILLWVYEFRLFELPQNTAWVWLLLIPADDFCYYWYHRAGHEIRLFWAGHVNHHSSTSYNLSTALRQSWTAPLTSWIFWLPLSLLGFHPLMLFVSHSISLLYQYWIHTELVGRMGPLEWVMNTPSHHRVHHGRNAKYLDRNHGGIFIIWDRLFGTFAAEEERPDYGLTHNIDSHNPVVIAFHEWAAMARDVAAAKTWRGRLGYLFGPPGWREDGTGTTSAVLRARAQQSESDPSSTAMTPSPS